MMHRLILLALVCALVPACGGKSDPAAAAGGASGMPPTVVQIAVAEPIDIEDATEYVATLRSLRSTPIQPQVEGQITRIFVKSGDRVAAGAPLLQIDQRRQQASVSSSEADRAAKQTNVSFARAELQRATELFTAGAISKQELERAETALRTAEAELKSLDAQVQEDEVQLRYFTVTAPTAGVVGDVPVRVGNLVTPQTILTRVEDNTRLEVHVPVPVERAAELKMGLPIHVIGPDAKPVATTSVTFVSSHVEGDSQAILVKAVVANPGGLRSDQFVRARLVWKATKGLTIPIVAVSRVSGQHFAFVAEGKDGSLVAKQRSVTLGSIVGNDYIVTAGIEPGDKVIISGVQKLTDGAPVSPGPPAGTR